MDDEDAEDQEVRAAEYLARSGLVEDAYRVIQRLEREHVHARELARAT
jgi:hypothetical protein